MSDARAAVIGASGRMGHALLRAQAGSGVAVVATLTGAEDPYLGRDAGELAGVGRLNLPLVADLGALKGAQVAIDFSVPHAAARNLAACVAHGIPLLLCTTGLPATLASELDAAAERIALIVAPNTSLGVTLLLELVRRAAAALPAGFDIEIFEAHHRAKRDAPSGTALALGSAAAEGRGQPAPAAHAITGSEPGPRHEGSIGYTVMRGGDVAGEHEVRFLGAGEQLRLGHVATDRAIFARGALVAARWLATRPPGRYRMTDVLDG